MKKFKEIRFLSSGIRKYVDFKIPEKELFLVRLRNDWINIVGTGIANHSYPMALRNGILIVNVDDSIWIQELTLQKDEIKENIYHQIKEEKFKNIFQKMKFKNGEIKKNEIKNEISSDFKIDNEKIKIIDETINIIEDKMLKEALREYLIKSNMKSSDENLS